MTTRAIAILVTLGLCASVTGTLGADLHGSGWAELQPEPPRAASGLTAGTMALFPPPGFVYPLDDASAFFPPHPASGPHGAPLFDRAAGTVVLPPPGAGGPAFSHLEWCHTRYASYRPSDNTFLPPRGPRRLCVSPYR